MSTHSKPLIRTEIEGHHPVELRKVSPRVWTVSYGKHIKRFHSFMQALAEHESCVLHAAECAGMDD